MAGRSLALRSHGTPIKPELYHSDVNWINSLAIYQPYHYSLHTCTERRWGQTLARYSSSGALRPINSPFCPNIIQMIQGKYLFCSMHFGFCKTSKYILYYLKKPEKILNSN